MEGVAGTFELARVTYVEGLVHLDRTAAAVRDSANGDPVVRTPSGHTAQRVLSAPPRGQLHVDVPTGRPGREQSATGVSNVNATTSGATSSRLVTTAGFVRRTGCTRDGSHREAAPNPPNNARTPHSAVKKRSRLRRP